MGNDFRMRQGGPVGKNWARMFVDDTAETMENDMTGAMVVVDPHRGNDGPRTWIRTWPADARSRLAEWNVVGRVGSYDSFTDVRPKYAAPGCLAVSAAVDAVVGVFVLVECEEPVAP